MLHFRRLASFLLGAWLAGSVFMDASAVQNFKSVDRFLADPGVVAAQTIHSLGRTETRTLLRQMVSEQNRFYFEHWEWMELALGLGLVLLLVFGASPPKIVILLALGMLAVVLGQRIALTPEIAHLGKVLDLIPAGVESAERKTFWMLHGIYSGTELLKIALGLTAAGFLTIRHNPDRGKFARESEMDEFPAARRTR